MAGVRTVLAPETGQSVVLVAVLLVPVMLGVAALAIDGSTLMAARQRAQSAADAGALAAAQDVSDGAIVGATATTDATTYVQHNDPNATVTVTAPNGSDPASAKVVVTQQVPLMLAGLFGSSTATVSATAVAKNTVFSPLGYFGDSDSDLQDGSATSDGWDNFCANDFSFVQASTYDSYSTSDSDDPDRCPQSGYPDNASLDGWTVAHGGVDVALTDQFYSPPGTTDQMVDLAGTCVEENGDFPSSVHGQSPDYTQITDTGTTDDDGYCENNADGELEQEIATDPGSDYTVSFDLGSNTWGLPAEKALMVVASSQDLAGEPTSGLPPMADTNGNDDTSGSEPYGTTYPLENSSYWSDSSVILAHEEYFYYGPTDNNSDPIWNGNDANPPETFTFTAATDTTWVGFGSLVNCVPDWYPTSDLSENYFYPSSIAGDTPSTSNAGVTTSSSFIEPPEEVHADDPNDGDSGWDWGDQCKYGPGVSDITITGPDGVSLTQ